MRSLVSSGETLLDALLVQRPILDREFARHELLRALLPGLELSQLDRHGDATLRLYFVDLALRRCGALHRGGHFVTSGRRSA